MGLLSTSGIEVVQRQRDALQASVQKLDPTEAYSQKANTLVSAIILRTNGFTRSS